MGNVGAGSPGAGRGPSVPWPATTAPAAVPPRATWLVPERRAQLAGTSPMQQRPRQPQSQSQPQSVLGVAITACRSWSGSINGLTTTYIFFFSTDSTLVSLYC